MFYLDVETNNNIVPVENITNIHANITMTDVLDILGPSLPGSDDTSSISCWNRVWQLSDGTRLKIHFISQQPNVSNSIYDSQDLSGKNGDFSKNLDSEYIMTITVDKELIEQYLSGFTANQAYILDNNNQKIEELF